MTAQDLLSKMRDDMLAKLPAKERRAKEAEWRAIEARAGDAFTARPLPDTKTLREIQAAGQFAPSFALTLERMLQHPDALKAEGRQ